MFQEDYKRFKSTQDIYLKVGDTITDSLNWKEGQVYRSFYWNTRLWGTELYINTEDGSPSVVSEEFLENHGFIEVE